MVMRGIILLDGTTYTMKPDSLVVVEENSSDSKQTKAARHRNHDRMKLLGYADPHTCGVQSPGSCGDTKAQLARTARRVKADRKTKSSEIVVSSGTAQVQRARKELILPNGKRRRFPANGPIQKSNVLAAADLVAPLNLAPSSPRIQKYPRTLEWKPVQDAVSYTLRSALLPCHENRDG